MSPIRARAVALAVRSRGLTKIFEGRPMSGSPGSTVGKITLGGNALLLLGVLADVSGLFNFVTGDTLHDLLNNSHSNVSRSPSQAAGRKTAPKNGSVRTNPPIQTPQGPPPAYLNDLEPVGG